MPVRPPVLDFPRFDPIYLTDEDLDDLATFTGLSRQECLARVKNYTVKELADAWRRADPRTPEEIQAFYASTDLYIWELMQWHASPARAPYWRALETLVEEFPPHAGFHRVLDFGCGIGTDGLFLAEQGYEVTLVEVDGPAFRFAQHRFARRGLNGRFVVSRSPVPQIDGTYDVIICFDVFEHLPEPVEAARRLIHLLRPGGVMAQVGNFGDDGLHPCHLPAGIARFSGLRWHAVLAGLGLRAYSGLLYRRTRGFETLVWRARWALWRATGIWMVYTGRG